MPQTRRPRRRPTEPKPIPAGLWFTLISVLALPLWWFRLPCMPMPLLAALIAGLTAHYPTTARKTDEPDPRKLRAYRRWKDILAGLAPNRDWTRIHRASYWLWATIGIPVSLNASAWWVWPVNLLCAWWLGQGVQHHIDRRADRRHPCTGVSIIAFWKNASTTKRVICATLTTLTLLTLGTLAYLDLTAPTLLAFTPIVFLTSIRLMDGKRQLSGWREQVRWQTLIDAWVDDEDGLMSKNWKNAYVSSVDTHGDKDNPLTALRIRVPMGYQAVLKGGKDPIRTHAFGEGLHYVQLLGAKAKKKGDNTFAPDMVRLVLAKDESAIPDITDRKTSAKTAGIVADLAYAQLGDLFRKTPPIVTAKDVSADPDAAAWLLTFTCCPTGADMTQIGRDWLANDPDPGTIMGLPVFRDLYDGFHLAANPDTPLDDKGNTLKDPSGQPLRPANRVTRAEHFGDYIAACRRWKDEQDTWLSVTGDKIQPPDPLFDEERECDCDGYTLTTLPFLYNPPFTLDDYAKHDLSPFDTTAAFIGVCDDGAYANGLSRMQRVTASRTAPTRLDELNGGQSHTRLYAKALAYAALLREIPSKGQVSIESVSQEGKTEPVWRIQIKLGNGVTARDMRRKAANIKAAMGVNVMYWEWVSADETVIWAMGRRLTAPKDAAVFKRRSTQQRLIPLAMSDAWGTAGVTDDTGQTPTVTKIGALPNNPDVLGVEFTVPGGVSIDRPKANIGKFLTAAAYPYGRITNAYGSTYYMVLASSSPFPTKADADWNLSRTCKPQMFPIGVDDLTNPVYWDTRTTPHLLVCGKTGSGKSSTCQIIIAEALLKGDGVIIIDPSKGANDFIQWAKPKALAFVGLYELRETEAVVTWVREEMAERVRLYSRYGVGNIKDLDPAIVSEEEREHLRPLTIMFDEFNSYLQETGKTMQNPGRDIQITNDNAEISARNASIARTMSALSKIIVQGRSAGIRVVFGAQRLTMDDMKKYDGNAFFRSLGRLLLGADSPMGVFSMGNVSEANRMQSTLKDSEGAIPVGRGMYESMQNTLTAVQTWWSGGQEELSELVANIPAPSPIDYSKYMPKAAEQFTKLDVQDVQELLSNDLPATADDATDDIVEDDDF